MNKKRNTKLAILMSTYNGEKYLSEQIESIISQTYKNWHLYIRDDGSVDNTQAIIQEYERKDRRISFFNKGNVKNIGVVRSFMELLNGVNADIYMFSDQDDVWLKNKIRNMLSIMLSENKRDFPICIHTDFKLVDSNLKEIGQKKRNVFCDFKELLFCNCVVGCTVMINEALKKMIDFKILNYDYIYMHDWWLALVASEFGKLIYLNKKTMLYRQHNSNVVGNINKSIISRVLDKSYDKKEINKILNICFAFSNIYGTKMKRNDYEYVNHYGNLLLHSSFLNNLLLVKKFFPKKRLLIQNFYFIYLLLRFPSCFKNNSLNFN